MWPWGHLAFGYLLYSVLVRLRSWDSPDGQTVLLVLLGTQFPDIVDKPLAWTFHLFPSGRSLAHSLFAVAAVSALVGVYYQRRGRPQLGIEFAVGYLSHLIGDGIGYLLSGEYVYLSISDGQYSHRLRTETKAGFSPTFRTSQFRLDS